MNGNRQFVNSVDKVVRRDHQGNIEFFNGYNWSYWIHEEDLKTRRGLIRWLRHLSDKEGWITLAHIRELIDLSHDLVGKSPWTEK